MLCSLLFPANALLFHIRKTIKPVEVGGLAGGQKFVVQGILFKVALESPPLSSADVLQQDLVSSVRIPSCASIRPLGSTVVIGRAMITQ